jgi:hypothetical protein
MLQVTLQVTCKRSEDLKVSAESESRRIVKAEVLLVCEVCVVSSQCVSVVAHFSLGCVCAYY